MIGILFATLDEARPFLTVSNAICGGLQPFQWYRIDTDDQPVALVVISGMGKVSAAMAATYLVLERQVSMLVNAGLCGRLVQKDDWDVGDLFRIRSAVEGDCDRFGEDESPQPCDETWFDDLDSARLVTCDRPVFDEELRNRLSRLGDLADMEGAAIARVAAYWKLPCTMVKGISDGADGNGQVDIERNMDSVSKRIGDILMRYLLRSYPK